MDVEVLENAQVNREFVYRFLWRLFAAEPDGDALELLAGPLAAEQFAILFEEGSAGLSAQRHLAKLASQIADEGAIDSLRDEFTRLFLGPAMPVVPLWESVQMDNDHLMFSQTTLDVREAYRATGFEASAYPKEADDHLAIELDYMAALAHRTLESIREGEFGIARAYCEHQRLFLSMHLTRWVPVAYDMLVHEIPVGFSDFYPYALALVREVCNTDSQIVVEFKQALLDAAAGASPISDRSSAQQDE